MADKFSQEFKTKYNEIQYSKIKQFRNIVAHDYFGVNAEEVWQIIKTHLAKLKNKIIKILNDLN